MKKTVFAAGALTIAAALALTVVSCTSDNDLINENQSENTQQAGHNKVYVSVGAGLNDGSQTKSMVEYNSGNHERKLKFTAGDRLYVRAVIETQSDDWGCEHETMLLAGFLDINTSSISPDGTAAIFGGDLTVYCGPIEEECDEEWVEDGPDEGHFEYTVVGYTINYYYESYYNFGDNNPLEVCNDAYAVLVHKDADSYLIMDDMSIDLRTTDFRASNADAFMSSILEVDAFYANGSFDLGLNWTQPILNCTISGLTAGVSYDAIYLYDYSIGYIDRFLNGEKLIADSQGKVSFAFIGCADAGCSHAIRLVNETDDYDWKLVDLGKKSLTGTVYNVSRTAVDDPDTPPRPVKPTLSRSDGLDTDELILDAPNPYDIFGTFNEGDPYDEDDNYYEEDVNMTISGNSTSYSFIIHNGGTVTLTGNGTAISEFPFLYARGSMTVMLGSDYTIDCRSSDSGIGADDYVYLGSVSGTRTLTIIVEEDTYDGIENYFGLEAASGCSYVLYSRTTNPDGTSTFVYKVTKN